MGLQAMQTIAPTISILPAYWIDTCFPLAVEDIVVSSHIRCLSLSPIRTLSPAHFHLFIRFH